MLRLVRIYKEQIQKRYKYSLTIHVSIVFRYLISIFTAGSLERRFEFKEEHSCKPFSWFLENIYPEKFILDDPEHVFAYGRLKNPHSNTCLDNLQNDDKDR